MTDPINELEAELSGMQPTPVLETLAGRIESDLMSAVGRASRWPDRFLLAAISSGALAACVLFGVLLTDLTGANASPGSIRAANLGPAPTRQAAAPLAFAHGSPVWIEFLH
jgi:hypothetical protein